MLQIMPLFLANVASDMAEILLLWSIWTMMPIVVGSSVSISLVASIATIMVMTMMLVVVVPSIVPMIMWLLLDRF